MIKPIQINNEDSTTMRISKSQRKQVQELALYPNEPEHSILQRLIKINEQHNRLCLKKVKQ